MSNLPTPPLPFERPGQPHPAPMLTVDSLGSLSMASGERPLRRVEENENLPAGDFSTSPSDRLSVPEVIQTDTHEALGSLSVRERPILPDRRTPEEVKVDLVSAYDKYEPAIRTLKAQHDAQAAPGKLGAGNDAVVYSVKVGDETVAIRLPKDNSLATAERYASGFIVAPGMDGYEQFKAMPGPQHETIATVSEVLPGEDLNKLGIEDVYKVTPQELERLVNREVAGLEAGLGLDTAAGNFRFHETTGITILDYRKRVVPYSDALAGTLCGTATALSIKSVPIKEYSPEGYTEYVAQCEARATILKDFSQVVGDVVGGGVAGDVAKHAGYLIETARFTASQYSDPVWVEQSIEGIRRHLEAVNGNTGEASPG